MQKKFKKNFKVQFQLEMQKASCRVAVGTPPSFEGCLFR